MTGSRDPATDAHEEWLDGAAAHALHALDAPGRARMDAHVRTCPVCARRVDEYRRVLAALPYALPVEDPPATLRASILGHARSTARPQGSPAPRAEPGRRTGAPPRPWATRLWRPAVWAAAVLGIVALGLWNVELRQRLARTGEPLEVGRLARLPVGPVVELMGTGTPGASARLYVTADGRRGELAVAGLPSLGPDRVYQLWFARPGETPITGGPFRVNAWGEAIAPVAVPLPLSEVRAIAITEEPAPGVHAPTGKHLLDRRG
jgi:anti-sigma-K factor RskA